MKLGILIGGGTIEEACGGICFSSTLFLVYLPSFHSLPDNMRIKFIIKEKYTGRKTVSNTSEKMMIFDFLDLSYGSHKLRLILKVVCMKKKNRAG